MDGNKCCGNNQTCHNLLSLFKLERENIKAYSDPNQNLGQNKIGYQWSTSGEMLNIYNYKKTCTIFTIKSHQYKRLFLFSIED